MKGDLAVGLACSFATGVLVGLTLQDHQEKKIQPKLSAQEEVSRAVLCPPNWVASIKQEYLDRDKNGRVVKRTWIRHCA